MAEESESPLDRLWDEYSRAFGDFDDLTLARWMAQTLGQLRGRVWRLSHPLVGAYRLATQVGHDRQVWLKRLVAVPAAYSIAECCRAPLLPLVTREVFESGLICQHCGAVAVPYEDLAAPLQSRLRPWAEEYAPLHAVAHPEETQKSRGKDFERACNEAAGRVEKLLTVLATQIMPGLLDYYPSAIWEDQDECLDVKPEDIPL
jgi:hypothetical protein